MVQNSDANEDKLDTFYSHARVGPLCVLFDLIPASNGRIALRDVPEKPRHEE